MTGGWLSCHLALMFALPSLNNASGVFYFPLRFGGWMLFGLIAGFAGSLVLLWRGGIKVERLILLVFTASLAILLFSALAFGAIAVHRDSISHEGSLYTLAGNLRTGEPGYYRLFRCDSLGFMCDLEAEIDLGDEMTASPYLSIEDNRLLVKTSDERIIYP